MEDFIDFIAADMISMGRLIIVIVSLQEIR